MQNIEGRKLRKQTIPANMVYYIVIQKRAVVAKQNININVRICGVSFSGPILETLPTECMWHQDWSEAEIVITHRETS